MVIIWVLTPSDEETKGVGNPGELSYWPCALEWVVDPEVWARKSRRVGVGRRPRSIGPKILESWPCVVGWEFGSRNGSGLRLKACGAFVIGAPYSW